MNLQVAIFQRCKCAFTRPIMSLVHVFGVHCHMRASSIGTPWTAAYQASLFQARVVEWVAIAFSAPQV